MTIDDLGAEKYISLATYKKDGTRVATPVWVARDGDHLYVTTEADSGKAKRLRNSQRAQVAACDMRGNVTGAAVDARAELLTGADAERVTSLIKKKYGIPAKLLMLRGRSRRVGIEITLT